MQAKCSGVKRDGTPCSAPTMGGSGFCVSHDPARVVQIAEWRRQGGAAKSNRARARKTIAAAALSTADLDAVLCNVLAKVVNGKLEANIGTAAATIAKAILAVREAGQLTDRLADVERLMRDGTAS